jgi:hypothetical protein
VTGAFLAVLRLPAVAQDDPGKTALLQGVLGRPVLVSQEAERRTVGVEEARVGEELDARAYRGSDDVPVLLDAPADLAARDEQEALDTAERCIEPRRIVVVGKANSDTLCSEITRPVEIASACDHSVGGNSLEEFGDDESTQPTSRCG